MRKTGGAMGLAVLTGDLIASQALPQEALSAAFAVLDDAARDVAGWEGCAGLRIGRFRGDGWQIALPCPALALRTALYLRACLTREGKGFATRIALATGPGTAPKGDIHAETGPTYVASGRGLDQIARPASMAFAGSGAMAAAVRLADHISQGWTARQARAVAPALPPGAPSQTEIARQIGITRQAARQALIGAGFPAIHDALAQIETAG